jgi:GNAT superfamily N-acetyltransferase
VLLRALAHGDVSSVVQLLVDSGLSVDHLPPIISARIGNRDAIYIGAFDNELLIGALLAMNTGTHVFLSHFAVHANYRRQGIGRLLHNQLLDAGEKLGCKGIIADSWLTAAPFYYQLGYRLPGAVFLVRRLGEEPRR